MRKILCFSLLSAIIFSMLAVNIKAAEYRGSYLDVWVNSWGLKVAELHISADDAWRSGTVGYVAVVYTIAGAGQQVAQIVPLGGEIFSRIFKAIADAVARNSDGSYDFFSIEIPPVGSRWGWFYAGKYPRGMNISWYPVPVKFFELNPGSYLLIFQ